MRQIVQKLKDGKIQIIEVPNPFLDSGSLLVRNHFSLLSAGTEGSTVRTARKSLAGKAKERPEQVKQVLDVVKSQGPSQAYRAVIKKLEAYSPMGYSTAGEVLEVGVDVEGFSVGDFVACAGVGSANHAEIVSVPTNLCVKLPRGADLRKSSYNTLGAIAMQGVRQADPRLGETCVVVGLGLIGQLTSLLLKASGIRVIGVDISAAAVETSRTHCVDLALELASPGIVESIQEFTHGLGADAVIITAGSSSLDPINFAGEIARKKGRVVVVGAVPTGFDRDPHYYRKELDLRMSCSYGPGRYDLDYEEKGIDYPAAYVRWTENRNMQAFQELVHSGKINISYLTTHEFPFEEAPKAYDLILEGNEPFLGILLHYDVSKPLEKRRVVVHAAMPVGKVSIGFFGAGSYAQSNLLPNIPGSDREISHVGVMTTSGTTSKRVAEKYGFEFCTSDEADLLENEGINTIFIATRHDSHADYVLKALSAGKNVFVEKPLCLTESQLDDIEDVYTAEQSPILMVGFNRRFSPLARRLKDHMGMGPTSMIYRINAGSIPADSWVQDMEIGGGRIIGEACHFVDFLTYMNGSLPKRVYAAAVPDPEGLNDVVNISLEFENGSIGTISYFTNGSKGLAKEYVEIHRGGVTGVLKDFKELELFEGKKFSRKKLLNQDKGQKTMVQEFIRMIKGGGAPLISVEETFAVTRATIKAVESLKSHQALLVSG